MIPLNTIDTFEQYEKSLQINNIDKRKNYFRYDMMSPLQQMWKYINVPIKAKQPKGYDVLMATEMLGYVNIAEDKKIREAIKILREQDAQIIAKQTLENCLQKTNEAGLHIKADELTFGLYIANREKLKLHNGYNGFGGIPGFITVNIYPNEYNIPRIPAVIAHEFHHNIRFSYFDWDYGNINVGDYLVIEGLAESFAAHLYGENLIGPWVTSMNQEELAYSTAVIGEALDIKGFTEVSSYMFGDEIAAQEGYEPVGLPFSAGYAVGYEVVQAYLKNTKQTIFQATLKSTEEIIIESKIFA